MLYWLMLCIVTHYKTGTFTLTRRKFSIFWHNSLLVNLAKLTVQELQVLKTGLRVPKKPVVKKKMNKKVVRALLHTQLNN